MDKNIFVKAIMENDFRVSKLDTHDQQDKFLQEQLTSFLQNNMEIKKDPNIKVEKMKNLDTPEDQDVFLQSQLESFLGGEVPNILSEYSDTGNLEKDSQKYMDKILDIYTIIDEIDIKLTETNILEFLQITKRWPFKYIEDTQEFKCNFNVPKEGFSCPIQVILDKSTVEFNKFYNINGEFLFDEWKKYYNLGFTTMISDVLDLNSEFRKLRSQIFNILGIDIAANLYLTKGGKKVISSWVEHKHSYSVIVKMIYGTTVWNIDGKITEYSEGDVILIPAQTYHSVIECPNERLSLTFNLF